jgi:SAM-dependent methyltransferase
MHATKTIPCSLCQSNTEFFHTFHEKDYYRCNTCFGVQMDPAFYLSKEEEEARYRTHHNDVEDLNYQKFVSPIVKGVKAKYEPSKFGLDFGAGTGPVITKLLEDDGYTVKLYDPFFWNDESLLQLKYDFIVSCEVIEHFYQPKKEFEMLYNMLKPGGTLYLKTDLYDDHTDFESWYYKNDPTHVFFYHVKTFNWIKKNFHFRTVSINNRMVQFEK